MTLQTEVIAVKDVKAGETVGYGGAWRAARDTRMAVVAVGYGDGYPRSAPSGTPVLVDGRRAPLIGRVSMDMITVDVTDLPAVSVGDPVVLWGGEAAGRGGRRARGHRSPYELLCGVSQRVRRAKLPLRRWAQPSKNPIFTPASWITSLSLSLRACGPIGAPLTSG